MKPIAIYASYGVLAHEKSQAFTIGVPAGEIYAVYLLVDLPDGFDFWENASGEIIISTPDEGTYLPREILTTWGDTPVFSWIDKHQKKRRVSLADYITKR